MKLHHIGYVVKSIIKFKKEQLLLGSSDPILVFDDFNQSARVEFYFLKTDLYLELIEPLKSNSHFTKFLQKNPYGGLHHFCYESKVIQDDIMHMKEKKYRQITQISKGFESRDIVFFMPMKITAPLIEIASDAARECRILPTIKV